MKPARALSKLLAALGGQLSLRRAQGKPPLVIRDRYALVRILGSGAFGAVLLGQDNMLKRAVALKCIPSSDPQQTRDILALEAVALAKIKAPEVVDVYDLVADTIRSGQDSLGFVAIVTEYVQGYNLREWVSRKPRSVDERLEVLLSAARGLEAAHREQIVHRDFKPENVIVTPRNEARLIDFGLAYAQGAKTPGAALARRGSFGLGTPAYMAPELRKGVVSPAVDQYAFAVTAWELLSGSRPFVAESRPSLLQNFAGFEELSLPVAHALARALQTMASERYQTMNELARALERANNKLERIASILAGTLAVGALAATAYHTGKNNNGPKKK